MRQTHGNKPSMRETHPHLADEFHPTKNGNLTPDNITAGSHQRVWWLCPTCDHEWPTTRCSNRISKGLTGCPYCNNSVLHSDGRNSMANTHPHLAKEYQGDATKIMLGGRKKLLWKCSTCDNEYLQSGRHRANGHGCPACTGRFLHSDGRNSMAVTHPHLALEYQGDATKIMAGTHHKIDWKCSTCDHKWEASGHNRVQANAGCPACSNKAIHIDGRNSMAKTHPHLAAEFHPTKNGNLTPDNLMAGSDEKVWCEVNIDIIDTMYFDVGKDAMEMEKTFHAMEEHRFTPKKKFGGWTEMFKASIVDVWNRMVKA
jgi:Zn finger protein HypA/HybF involved in hydrogenase expression